jgi:branched-chain amino acid transport system permease protein
VNLAYSFDPYEIGPLLVDKPRVYAEAAAIVVAAALLWFFRYTRTGAAIRACADNLTARESSG